MRGNGSRRGLCDPHVILVLPTTDHVFDTLLEGRMVKRGARVVQAAAAGRWEDARAIELPTDAGSVRSLVRDAGPPGSDVAVEFEWLAHPLVFVGARRASGEAEAFEDDVVRVAELDLHEPAVALATLAGRPPAELNHVELGAANAWQSVGPLRLWTCGQDGPPADLAAGLAAHPALARCTAPVALEVAFDHPRECWIGVEVSQPAGDGHVVDVATVTATLDKLFSVGAR